MASLNKILFGFMLAVGSCLSSLPNFVYPAAIQYLATNIVTAEVFCELVMFLPSTAKPSRLFKYHVIDYGGKRVNPNAHFDSHRGGGVHQLLTRS